MYAIVASVFPRAARTKIISNLHTLQRRARHIRTDLRAAVVCHPEHISEEWRGWIADDAPRVVEKERRGIGATGDRAELSDGTSCCKRHCEGKRSGTQSETRTSFLVDSPQAMSSVVGEENTPVGSVLETAHVQSRS